jgi:hypothetical protein
MNTYHQDVKLFGTTFTLEKALAQAKAVWNKIWLPVLIVIVGVLLSAAAIVWANYPQVVSWERQTFMEYAVEKMQDSPCAAIQGELGSNPFSVVSLGCGAGQDVTIPANFLPAELFDGNTKIAITRLHFLPGEYTSVFDLSDVAPGYRLYSKPTR